jgi:hypothetical protein
VDRFNSIPEATLPFDGFDVVIAWRRFVERPPDLGDINVDELFGLRIVDGTEIQRIGILAVVNVRAIVHQRLLETDIVSKPLIVTDCPCCVLSAIPLLLFHMSLIS